jgi:hypothetical protein
VARATVFSPRVATFFGQVLFQKTNRGTDLQVKEDLEETNEVDLGSPQPKKGSSTTWVIEFLKKFEETNDFTD